MLVRLKTLDELIKEFGFKWNGEHGDHLEYNTEYEGMKWKLVHGDILYLGKEIEVYDRRTFNYPYISYLNDDKQLWHDKWFAEIIDKGKEYFDTAISKDRYLLIMRYFMFVMRNETLPIKKSDIIIKIRKAGKKYDFRMKELKDFMDMSPFNYLNG